MTTAPAPCRVVSLGMAVAGCLIALLGATSRGTDSKGDASPPPGHQSPGSAVPQPPARLVTGVHTDQLLAALGTPGPPRGGSVDELGVSYGLPHSSSGGMTWVRIAVLPSVAAAEAVFREDVSHRSYIWQPPPPKGIGDNLICPVSEGRGIIVLRRWNVLIAAIWAGTRAAAFRSARKLDGIIMTDDRACPKGGSVPVANVELTAPHQVTVGPHGFTVAYQALDGIVRTAQRPELSTHGDVHIETGPSAREAMMPKSPPVVTRETPAAKEASPRKEPSYAKTASTARPMDSCLPPGLWTFSVVFATATNVVFTRTFTTELVTEEAAPTVGTPPPPAAPR